jgi:hypothetical protein
MLPFVLLAVLALPGCTLLDSDKSEAKAPKLAVSKAPPIRPEHVTPGNAAQKLRELNEELDRDAEGEAR